MNWNDIEANWHQLRGAIRENFAKLTDDDLLEIGGKVEVMVGKLQEKYGLSLEEAKSVIEDIKLNADGTIELETSLQGEGDIEASRRFQEAQHQFAEDAPSSDTDNK